jgi:hypothetical protein
MGQEYSRPSVEQAQVLGRHYGLPDNISVAIATGIGSMTIIRE